MAKVLPLCSALKNLMGCSGHRHCLNHAGRMGTLRYQGWSSAAWPCPAGLTGAQPMSTRAAPMPAGAPMLQHPD